MSVKVHGCGREGATLKFVLLLWERRAAMACGPGPAGFSGFPDIDYSCVVLGEEVEASEGIAG